MAGGPTGHLRWWACFGVAILLAAGACASPSQEEGHVVGRVVNVAGEAVAGAHIAVLQGGGPAEVPGQKDAQVSGEGGRFRVRRPAGRYELKATMADQSTDVVGVGPGARAGVELRFATNVPTQNDGRPPP